MASSLSSPPCLYGDGIDAQTLSVFARACGFQSMPEGLSPDGCGGRSILAVTPEQIPELPVLMGQRCHAALEIIDGEGQIDPESLANLTTPMLGFSLSTISAYNNDCASMVCDVLLARGALSPVRRSDIELALHEAISNAVVHGNLCVQSNTKGDLGHFAKFALELQAMMASPEARRRIDIACNWDHEFLDISITDKGRGYDASMLPKDVDPFVPAGRGLAIIRSLALSVNVTHGGRVTTLRFLV